VGGSGADTHVQRRAAFATFASSPLNTAYQLAVANGDVAVTYTLSGQAQHGKRGAFKCKATDYFSLVRAADGTLQIARLVRFFDTWAVATSVFDL
jgi:hypothetical protein